MKTKLIKQFLLEQGYVSGDVFRYKNLNDLKYSNMMYRKVVDGEIGINRLDFDIWLKHLEQNNILFGQVGKQLGYLGADDISEIALDPEKSVCRYFLTNADKLVVTEEDELLYNPSQYFFKGRQLVMNGVYSDALDYITTALEKGKFSVGILGDKNEYVKRQIEFYRNIRRLLVEGGVEDLEVVDESIQGKKLVYTLNFNCQKRIQEEPEEVKSYPSNR